MIKNIKPLTCLSCKLGKLELIYDFGQLPLVNSYFTKEEIHKEELFPLELYYCSSCWLVQLSYFPNPKKMYNEYHYVSGASKGNVDHLNNFSAYLKNIGGNRKSVLEIGSNDNTLVKNLSNLGYKCLAVDPAKNLNLEMENTISQFFNLDMAKKLESEGKFFDIIIGINVFAHNDTFIDMFEGCKLLLDEDGLLIIEVAYALKTVLNGNFDTIYHEHVCSYTLTSIENALNSIGLYISDAEEINTQGGSIRVTAQKKKPTFETKSYLAIKQYELKHKVQSDKFYRNASKNIEKKLIQINELFEKKYSERFLILGSPARGVVTLNVSNQKIHKNSLIIDDTPEKQNKVMPGVHLPVVTWDEVDYQEFKNVLILSWNYKDHLIKKLKEKDFQGEVYTPFPEIFKEIIS